MQIAQHYDLVIVGGGMVGASLAALLPNNFNVLIIESHSLPSDSLTAYQPSYDARSTAISHGSFEILQQAGVWQHLAAYAQAISDVHVSDKGHWGSVSLSHQQQQWPALGYVVENALLGRGLLHVLSQLSHVHMLCPAKLTDIQVIAGGVNISVQQDGIEHRVNTPLLVVADGATSDSCRILGIQHAIRSYGHTAIVANLSTDKAHQGIAYERFTRSGPIALLPQISTTDSANRSVLIWTLPDDEAKALLALSDSDFLQQLQQHFGHWQGQFIRIGKRSSYPLKLSRAKEQVRQHIVVLGNAAHSLHPVAGQGFNLALRDTKVLADLLIKAKQKQQALGDLTLLNRYIAQQINDQDITILFSDRLPSLFSQNPALIQLGRNLGLLSLELSPSLKASFTRFAAGLRQQESTQ